jgi:hypothetical protein
MYPKLKVHGTRPAYPRLAQAGPWTHLWTLSGIGLLVSYDVADCRDIRSFDAGGKDVIPDPFRVFLKVHQETPAIYAVVGLGVDFMREVLVGHLTCFPLCPAPSTRPAVSMSKHELVYSVPTFKDGTATYCHCGCGGTARGTRIVSSVRSLRRAQAASPTPRPSTSQRRRDRLQPLSDVCGESHRLTGE